MSYTPEQRRQIIERSREMAAQSEARQIEYEIWHAENAERFAEQQLDADLERWRQEREAREREENRKAEYVPWAIQQQQQQRLQQQQTAGLSGLIIKREAPVIFKSIGYNTEGRDYVITSNAVDRYQDIVVPQGLDWTDFSSNPVALAYHRHDFPIGVWKDLRLENNAVRARLVLAAKGSSQRIDEVRALCDQKVLVGCSIGFVAHEQQPLPSGGIKYTRSSLLEVSVVSVGANPAALAVGG